MRRAVLLAVLLLALAGCSSGGRTRQASPSTVTAVKTVTAAPSPSGADADYLADLTSSSTTDDAAYVNAHAANLVRFGHGICDDLRRGVSDSDESNAVTQQLVADADFDPGVTDGTSYGNVRTAQAVIFGTSVMLAARVHLCPDAPQG